MCGHVCGYVCVYVGTCMCVCICVHVCSWVRVCVRVGMCACMCVSALRGCAWIRVGGRSRVSQQASVSSTARTTLSATPCVHMCVSSPSTGCRACWGGPSWGRACSAGVPAGHPPAASAASSEGAQGASQGTVSSHRSGGATGAAPAPSKDCVLPGDGRGSSRTPMQVCGSGM